MIHCRPLTAFEHLLEQIEILLQQNSSMPNSAAYTAYKQHVICKLDTVSMQLMNIQHASANIWWLSNLLA